MEKQLSVPEVHCDNCINSIEGALKTLDGVSEAKVDLDSKSVKVAFDDEKVTQALITETIEDQGYMVGDGPRVMQIEKPHGNHHNH